MTRTSFVKQLKKIGDIPTPSGHLRRHKGVTTYFFDATKIPAIESLLRQQGLENKGQVRLYRAGTILWEDGLSRCVFLHHPNQDQTFASVAILEWF